MTSHDLHVRVLERKFLQTGSPTDEAAWLVARRRAGRIDPRRVALAAYLGSESARAASTPWAPTANPAEGRAREVLLEGGLERPLLVQAIGDIAERLALALPANSTEGAQRVVGVLLNCDETDDWSGRPRGGHFNDFAWHALTESDFAGEAAFDALRGLKDELRTPGSGLHGGLPRFLDLSLTACGLLAVRASCGEAFARRIEDRFGAPPEDVIPEHWESARDLWDELCAEPKARELHREAVAVEREWRRRHLVSLLI